MHTPPLPESLQDIITGAASLEELLSEEPITVSRIIDTPPDEFVVLDPEALRKYVFDELFRRTQRGSRVAEEAIIALQYITNLVCDLRTPMLMDAYGVHKTDERYVIDRLESGEYQKAGDTAIYGFIHMVGKRKNPLSKEDYIDLAEMCYYRWYEKKPQSIGLIVASQVRSILHTMRDWRDDMMVRAPAYRV